MSASPPVAWKRAADSDRILCLAKQSSTGSRIGGESIVQGRQAMPNGKINPTCTSADLIVADASTFVFPVTRTTHARSFAYDIPQPLKDKPWRSSQSGL